MKQTLKPAVLLGLVLPVVFWLAVLSYLLAAGSYRNLIYIIAGGILLRAFCEIIYFFYKKPRPYQKSGVIPPHSWWLFSPQLNRPDSFPSAHAAISFFGAFVLLYFGFVFLAALALLAAFLNAWGRVSLKYHDWLDILGGGVLAGFWLILFVFVVRM